MPTVIRRSVFETNSSSSHSVTIAGWPPKGKTDSLPVSGGGVCSIWPGEFGWEEDTFYDAETKASYCYMYARENPDQMKQLENVIREQTGCKQVRFEEGDGWIDHQSSDVAREAFASDDTLRAFIFNPDSVLRTDNDNH